MIDAILTERIERELFSNKPMIVAVCGAADLGKSYLSKQIINCLNEKGVKSGHLTLDSFLMDRDLRKSKGFSGYQIESYDLESSLSALRDFKNNKEITYHPYDHGEGKRSSIIESINDCSVLIFDGLHVLNTKFSHFIDFSLFIYTSDESLKEIRSHADLTKRGLSDEESQLNSEPELQLYKSNVEPYINSANIRLQLKDSWEYDIVS